MPVEFPATDYAREGTLQALLTQLATPIPVSIAGGAVEITATNIEISNDLGNPIPVSSAQLHADLASIDGHVDGVEALLAQLSGQLPAALAGGRLSVDASGVPVPITDNGGSLTVDGTVDLGAMSLAALESITVVDGGGSLTVDGPLTDAQLRAANVGVTVSNPFGGDVTDRAARLLGHVTVDNATLAVTQSGAWTPDVTDRAARLLGHVTVDNASLTTDVSDRAARLLGHVTVDAATIAALTDGTARIGGTVTVDSELPAAAVLGDTAANPTAPAIGAFPHVYDGTGLTWNRLRGLPASFAVNTSVGTAGVLVTAMGVHRATGDVRPIKSASSAADGESGDTMAAFTGYAYNGASFDRVRGNMQGTLLASAARTATTASAQQTNYNARGVLIHLNVTAASGTGGLAARVRYYDPVSGSVQNLLVPTNVTTTGYFAYMVYPGVTSTAVTKVESAALPRIWDVNVTHGDASSYTYSVGYSLIL